MVLSTKLLCTRTWTNLGLTPDMFRNIAEAFLPASSSGLIICPFAHRPWSSRPSVIHPVVTAKPNLRLREGGFRVETL